jgi:hypothetical protein
MTLPKGWRTSRADILNLRVLACVVGTAVFIAMLALFEPHHAGPYTRSERILLLSLVLFAVMLGMLFIVVLRQSAETAGRARSTRLLGFDQAAGAVVAFLRGRGIAHREVPGKALWRAFELDRVRIDVRYVNDHTTWVLVGPAPAGDDPGFNALLVGLGEALEEARRAGAAPRHDPPVKPGG